MKATVKFYTDSNKYMGWCFLNKKTYYNQIKNWLVSGNFVVINHQQYGRKDLKIIEDLIN